MKAIAALGIMSGTSLDGVDLAYCKFSHAGNSWQYSIEHAETIPYSAEWITKLRGAETLPSLDLLTLHAEYGQYLGRISHEFIIKHQLRPKIIASHGHTIFHQPTSKVTFQLGHGSAIAAVSGIDTVWDFRSGDVMLGGQGAPLVPIGDLLLFSQYDVCLNLGGFGNISYQHNGHRLAYDTSPVNIVLNNLALELGHSYDCNGELGRNGQPIPELLQQLNNLDYYKKVGPKSLGSEWIEQEFLPILKHFGSYSTNDRLHTVYLHIAQQIGACLSSTNCKNVLVTGGGAKNSFLVSLLRQNTKLPLVIPDTITIDYKEALIFAFLGVLYLSNIGSSLATVTGAERNSVAGVMSKGGGIFTHS
ncbi:MAG TPA: anhydro-N-acetylmuramic acid kinase [Williamwhitmania sp.]|nr:anhydro-N-acetylmuramic acid kinase [Williamwhitmania sp.]